ncbi:MAG TPA: 5'-nucleotidase, lipoprotein e(P4) family [Bacteroidota bacterium]
MKPTTLVFASLSLILVLGLSWRGTSPPSENEHQMTAVLWFQVSAERRALCYQAFQTARFQLDRHAANRQVGNPGAVVVDIDETVLDNSPHSAKMILENKSFPYGWTEWVNKAGAEPIPGALEFLRYAVSKGYSIFYVSNRSAENETDGTIRNLRERGFPQADSGHVLLQEGRSGKEIRRQKILLTHEIVLLIGDNLNDHAETFEKNSIEERFAETDRLRDEFGVRYIVLPNPMYGEWESAIYRYGRGLSAEEKNVLRRSALTSF